MIGMKQGSLEERYLARSVIKHIRKQNKELSVGAAVGHDYAQLGNLISAEATARDPQLAFMKALNNFYCSAGTPVGVRFSIFLPEQTKESHIKQIMAELNAFAEQEKIQVLGGHTEVSNVVLAPLISVTVLGYAGMFHMDKKRIKPGFALVLVGTAGLYGTDYLARNRYEELTARFSRSYIESAFRENSQFMIKQAALLAACCESAEVCYMHDISHGGIYGALWQTGVWMDKGFLVEHSNIPICQETIEICEFYNKNPYMLDGTGGMLVVASKGDLLVEHLREAGILASVIGTVTEGREKMIRMNDADKRCLSPVSGDEIY